MATTDMLTRDQQDGLMTLIRRKGYRPRGRGGFLDRLGVGDAMTLDLLPEASWRWAVTGRDDR